MWQKKKSRYGSENKTPTIAFSPLSQSNTLSYSYHNGAGVTNVHMQPALVTRKYYTEKTFPCPFITYLLLKLLILWRFAFLFIKTRKKTTTTTIKIIVVQSLLKPIDLLSPRNPSDSQNEVIQVPMIANDGLLLTSALLDSGFRVIHSSSEENLLLPCPLGTFSNRFTRGTDGCTNCTPGKLYNIFWNWMLGCVFGLQAYRLNRVQTIHFVAADV